MKRQKSGMMRQAGVKLSRAVGATMGELLAVIAIIGILGGLAFVAVWNYQRSMGQLERDNIAKEIFIAAQNHLTMAKGEGYLGVSDYGTEEGDGVFYYVVNNGAASSGDGMFAQMLPFGSIEETVRAGGSYIVRYQPKAGLVLDVFYCSTSGSPAQFNYSLSASDYSTVLSLRDTETASHRLDRRNWNKHILGWYGGAEAQELATLKLETPTIEVINAEKLKVIVTDTNYGTTGAQLKLIVEGVTSNAKIAYSLSPSSTGRVHADTFNKKYEIVLDDITTNGMHFCEIIADTASEGKHFIPGEDVKIYAVAYSNSALSNIAYSESKITNSLFASVDDSNGDETPDTAIISNIRHLENLNGNEISGLMVSTITRAEQTNDLSWPEFQQKITGNNTDSVSVYFYDVHGWKATAAGSFYPVNITDNNHIKNLNYDGQGHSISGITVKKADADPLFIAAGVFGTYIKGSIQNLELLDFDISGAACVGALGGAVSNTTVSNVIARNTYAHTGTADIRGDSREVNQNGTPTLKGQAGGLIGIFTQGTIQNCAASLRVSGAIDAGGLIGKCGDTVEVTGCYSGGHTADGSYEKWISGVTGDPAYPAHTYDVTGATAGGLIGDAGSAIISNSYSTCSVSGTTKAGGFAGEAEGSITNCYATGLIDQTQTAAAKYAFVAVGSPTLSGNAYYSVINAVPKPGGQEGETEPMAPYSGYALSDTDATANTALLGIIKPLDLNADTYNTFTGAWDDWARAEPYDTALPGYYGGKYPLKAIKEMDPSLPDTCFVCAHYGDWPSPEVFFINTK